jgi:hypothetical protein
MVKKLANVQEAMNSLLEPRKPWTVTSGYGADGSLIESCAGFAIHQMGMGGYGHIAEFIRPSERCLILTDSLSSLPHPHPHPLVYERKRLCWSLYQNKIEVKLMWIPSHVGLVGN